MSPLLKLNDAVDQSFSVNLSQILEFQELNTEFYVAVCHVPDSSRSKLCVWSCHGPDISVSVIPLSARPVPPI